MRIVSSKAALLAVLALVFLACQGRDESRAPGRPSARTVQGLSALPSDARVVVAFDAGRLRGSSLARRAVARSFARDPAGRDRLLALAQRCHVDPERDVEQVLVGITPASELVLVALGKFEEQTLATCLSASVAEKGGTFEKREVAGAPAWVVKLPDRPGGIWLGLGSADTLIVSSDETVFLHARDPGAAKVSSVPELDALLGKVDTHSAVWAVGLVPPESSAARAVVAMAGGKVSAPMRSVVAELAFDRGLRARFELEMNGEADASALADFTRRELGAFAQIAQTEGLGGIIDKITVESNGSSVRGSLVLDAAEIGRLETQLEKHQGQAKEGATP